MKTAKWLLTAAVLSVISLAIACGGDGGDKAKSSSPSGNVVKITGEEWKFTLDKESVPAGDVTFSFTNKGKVMHEAAIYSKQDMAARINDKVEAKKKGASAALKDSQAIKGWVDEIEDVDPGQTKTLTVKLAPGTYEIGCLVTETGSEGVFNHHQKNMFATLTVK